MIRKRNAVRNSELQKIHVSPTEFLKGRNWRGKRDLQAKKHDGKEQVKGEKASDA